MRSLVIPAAILSLLLSGCSTEQFQKTMDSFNESMESVGNYFSEGRYYTKTMTVEEQQAEQERLKEQVRQYQAKQAAANKTKEKKVAQGNKQVAQENTKTAQENWNIARTKLGTADAIPYLVAAAEAGHPAATYNLAMAFLQGKGVNPNYQQAEILMGDAARLKYPQAQYVFANMMMQRAKTVYDPNHLLMWLPRAYAWYAVAERNGVKAATAPKNRLKNMMTRKVYGPDAEVNAYMWDEAQRLTADGFSKYLN